MADRYLLESGAPDGYQLEDDSGVLLLEELVTQVLIDTQVVLADPGSFPTSPSHLPLTIGDHPNRYVEIWIAHQAAGITAMARNGQNFARVGNYGTAAASSLWGLVAPDVGTFDVDITHGGGTFRALAGSYYNVDQTTPRRTAPSEADVSADTITPSNAVTSAVEDLVVGWMTMAHAGAMTGLAALGTGANLRLQSNDADSDGIAALMDQLGLASSTDGQFDWTTPTANGPSIRYAIAAAAGAAAGPRRRELRKFLAALHRASRW